MEPINVIAGLITVIATVIAAALLIPAIRRMLSVMRAGAPAHGRKDQPGQRTKHMLTETLGHTRMLQWHWIGVMHWFVFFSFIILSSAVATGYLQVWNPHLVLPIIGHFFLFEWVSELVAWLGLIGIAYLVFVRQRNNPKRLERRSRFFGSRMGQAYFVEAMVALECAAGILIRGAEYRLGYLQGSEHATTFHFPLTAWVGRTLWSGLNEHQLEVTITIIAVVKVLSATIWLMVIAVYLTMGVAWHRFLAWFNIWFKRESDGGTALGALVPLYVNDAPLDLETMEDLDEEHFEKLGVGKVEDFTWKGILDFSTCTECGRCQSQCPAWNTEKPLSPKLVMMGLREHAYAKIPLLGADPETLTEEQQRELERPLVGTEDLFGVIDPDVLWSCTNCGACVQQCPVDIEHVDHIDNMRRFQVLVESNFPAELNNIFKGLERKGNPWGMNPRDRMKWTEGLDFEVKQVGVDVESLDEVDWLFWVGCAGAFEDRAKKTTQAVAELLNIAGVDFAVLGDGETCTGDSARRAGNEIVFKQLAMENAAVFEEMKVKKVVSTCAHCFNTLKNEYTELGVELEVVHHTQLLNRLVREGKLKPVAPAAATQRVTYHDPCFLGRHNQVYTPPRELIGATGADYVEMERSQERSFCCGAGGARMWMEEKIGSRINVNRTEEAIGTGADKIAVGCPFCRVMLSDGLTAKQHDDESLLKIEVLDVAQLLLQAVKRSEEDVVAEAEAVTAAAAGDEPTDAEPGPQAEADPQTLTDTAEVGAAAAAHEEAGPHEAGDLDEPDSAGPAEDAAIAAQSNIAVDEKGDAGGPMEPADATPEGVAEAEAPEPVAEVGQETPAEAADQATDEAQPEREHHTASQDAPRPDPHAEEGDSTDPDDEVIVSHDDRPELAPTRENDGDTPAEELYDDSPTAEDDSDRREELAAMTPAEDAPVPDPVSEDTAATKDDDRA